MNNRYFTLLTSLFLFVLLNGATIAKSQDKTLTLNTLRLEARADFSCETQNNQFTSGFHGKSLNVVLDGNISSKFSYAFRQRLNISDFSATSLFRGTDRISLTYHLNDNFSFTAGKFVLGIGGWEYDLAPIDILHSSGFWGYMGDGGCYQIGCTAAYTDKSKNHQLEFQFTNSPYAIKPLQDIYAYNLIWFGKMDFFRTSYSINFFEYSKGKFVNFISLGNGFYFDHFEGYIDLAMRARIGDYENDITKLAYGSIIAEAKYIINDKVSVFARGGYNRNNIDNNLTIRKDMEGNIITDTEGNPLFFSNEKPFDTRLIGIENGGFYAVGCEYYPLKSKQEIRLHALFAGRNTTEDSFRFDLGLTWRMNFRKN